MAGPTDACDYIVILETTGKMRLKMEAANDNRVIISIKDVCNMTSLSRTAVNNWRRTGQFPQHVQLGEKRLGFVKTEVLAWINQRIAARQAA